MAQSNATEQHLLSNPVVNEDTTTQKAQTELGEPTDALGQQSGETASNEAHSEIQPSISHGSGGANFTGGSPADDGPRPILPSLEGTPQPGGEEAFWACCGGSLNGCPFNGLWLEKNVPACIDCEHIKCVRCQLRVHA
ncbi:hypothetical protein L873DRAFT_1722769 [Choiromyces venosus 120613-1]|uniref:Uncharacterized protein n=1 Tax=Choiromyces venosus 120613-1 TaxID=1336337 RepID=A0A3N4ITJ8_9PEZI|nr:hypothetical protein L873DRAFT_1722769 [Choiromyces venosus 120613-1]